MWIVDADTLIDAIKDMSILIDGYIEKSDDYIRTVKCSECEYLKVHNTEALYAFCPKFGIEFYPFENDTRKHGCSWGKPKGRALVQADRKTEPQTEDRLRRLQMCVDCEHTDMCEWCYTRWSKDEPQTEKCQKCKQFGNGCYIESDGNCLDYKSIVDEPQTSTYNPTSVNNLWEKPTNPYVETMSCQECKHYNGNDGCNVMTSPTAECRYEPQTDCAWGKDG